MEPRNRFQGMNSASLYSLAGWYDNPIPTRFLAPIDCLKKFQLWLPFTCLTLPVVLKQNVLANYIFEFHPFSQSEYVYILFWIYSDSITLCHTVNTTYQCSEILWNKRIFLFIVDKSAAPGGVALHVLALAVSEAGSLFLRQPLPGAAEPSVQGVSNLNQG